MLIVPLTAKSVTIEPITPHLDSFLVAEKLLAPAKPATIQEQIEDVFGKGHVMVAIAGCESSMRQFEASGEVLMGGYGKNYIGIFQIGKQWVPRAISMGMDVYTVEGNIAFAKWLYDEEIVKRGSPLWKQWECALHI